MILNRSTYKSVAISLVIIFGVFIITPTVVTLIEKDADVSLFYSAAEEESKETIKIVDDRIAKSMYDTPFLASFISGKGTMVYIENLHASCLADKFCPPPEFS
ncbi:hypothetical protein [Sinomicrobium soli]|uniref:hypothetical protein n=1 Tax=Sinomicrobium sp. N-1-3-6 TaxID=2219864 RepID=UPI000DCB1ED5|nr:hypothetical protein [Sinomicrobium sp. N-1-3-6]RAV29445.1 hypothetical protein DN748_08040 [Sinomicrobium sp. N-1-3-6]